LFDDLIFKFELRPIFEIFLPKKLRKGNTYSSEDAAQMIHHTMSEIPSDIKKYFRADSAYSSQEIYNTLLNQKYHFTICLKQNVWAPILTKRGMPQIKFFNIRIFFLKNGHERLRHYPAELQGTPIV
jgi:hypothetical protein